MLSQLSRVIAIAAIVGVSAIVILSGQRQTSATDPNAFDWPSFEMTYVNEGHFNGLSQPAGSETWSIIWNSKHDWEKTLVASSVNPAAVGDVYRFRDGNFVVDQSTIEDDIVREHGDGVVMPGPWLVPGRDTALPGKGYSTLPQSEPDRLVFQHEDVVPCQPDPDGMLTGLSQPESCNSADSFTRRETITYRTDITPPMPIEIVNTIDGEEISHMTVTDLTLLPESGS
ncbi:MAG: hypothetical protein M9890_03220 [Thermomicrobiales bacterium]|nr:hypothetical protein [Thermomicrobiales bacterium]